MDSLILVIIVVVIAAVVILRSHLNDPASPIGGWYDRTIQSWYDRHVRSRYNLGFKIFIYLTMILWFVVYLATLDNDPTGLGDLFEGALPSGGGDEKK